MKANLSTPTIRRNTSSLARFARVAACLFLASGLLASCDKLEQKPAPSAPPPAVPVSVAKAEQRDMPIQLRSVGNMESIASVLIRPQVSGRVLRISPAEGRDVAEGDPILFIDPRPFDASLREAEAALAKSTAIATDQRRAAQQLRVAYGQKAVAVREVEQAEAQAASAEAQVLQDQAAIETAKLNLSYCAITAPFAGRLGAFLVKPGAIVKENDTALVDITQVAPIDAVFTIREQDLAALRAANSGNPLQVFAAIPGDSVRAQGQLNFIDNRVDPNTGAIRLKARFDNADHRLWPGQFINTTITLGHDEGATVIPASAIQASQRGQAVFVIKDEATAEMRQVKVRRIVDGVAVIDSGVAPGETIVTDGQLRLTNGSKVSIKPQAPGTPSGAAGDLASGAAK